jgi:hypothetical protein
MEQRLDAAEASLARADAEKSDLAARADAAERSACEAAGTRQRQLADVTNLRCVVSALCGAPTEGKIPMGGFCFVCYSCTGEASAGRPQCTPKPAVPVQSLSGPARPGPQVCAAQLDGRRRRNPQSGAALCGAGTGARKGGTR